jgi:hypothetical protein
MDTSDVRFKYNVPYVGPGGLYGTDINAQALLGRGATSTAGRWVVYAQGAYEGDPSEDNDPDSEVATGGITASARNSLTFVETIRDASVPPIDNLYVLSQIALHEIGHQFNLGDATGCVMSTAPVASPVFCPAHLRTIRSTAVPSAP